MFLSMQACEDLSNPLILFHKLAELSDYFQGYINYVTLYHVTREHIRRKFRRIRLFNISHRIEPNPPNFAGRRVFSSLRSCPVDVRSTRHIMRHVETLVKLFECNNPIWAPAWTQLQTCVPSVR